MRREVSFTLEPVIRHLKLAFMRLNNMYCNFVMEIAMNILKSSNSTYVAYFVYPAR